MKLIFILVAFSLSIPAFAAKFSLVGAANMAKPNGAAYSEQMTTDGGFLLEFNVGKKGGVELGVLRVDRAYTFSTTFGTATTVPAASRGKTYVSSVTVPVIEIPLMYRLWFNRVLSFGIGGVASIACHNDYCGDATISTAGTGTDRSTLNQNSVPIPAGGGDFAAAASLKLMTPLTQKFGIMADGRYNYGLSGGKFREVQGLAGLVFANNMRGKD